jgi:hypothetical protein
MSGDYELEMPFKVCQSQGGPYEDEPFVAGYQAGRLAGRLDAAAAIGANHLVEVVYVDLLPQIDLIAMRAGYTMDPVVDGEWATVSLLLDVEEPS